jgi:hypothetical protein
VNVLLCREVSASEAAVDINSPPGLGKGGMGREDGGMHSTAEQEEEFERVLPG